MTQFAPIVDLRQTPVFLAYIVVSVVLAMMLAASAWSKLTRDDRVVTAMTGVGVRLKWFPHLAGLLLAGAVGLLAGIAFAPLGITAAAGVGLYFVAALIAHLRVNDTAVGAPLMFLALAAAAVVLGIASL